MLRKGLKKATIEMASQEVLPGMKNQKSKPEHYLTCKFLPLCRSEAPTLRRGTSSQLKRNTTLPTLRQQHKPSRGNPRGGSPRRRVCNHHSSSQDLLTPHPILVRPTHAEHTTVAASEKEYLRKEESRNEGIFHGRLISSFLRSHSTP